MSSRRLAVLAPWLFLAACASGTENPGGDDDDQPAIDAPAVGEDDAPVPPDVDAPDVLVDAPDVPIDAAPIDAPIIDAPPIDAPVPVDAAVPIDAAPPLDGPQGPIDTCAQAMDLTAAAMMPAGVTVSGTTGGYANNVQVPTACTAYTTSGPDAVYSVTVGAGRTITATATPSTSWDLSIYLATSCGLSAACGAGDDSSLDGVAENISFTTASAGTFYIVIDSWSSTVSGAYSLALRVQ